MSFRQLAVLLMLFSPSASGETVTLAECPKAPLVIGEYKNDGQKCVRNRSVIAREIVDVECPSEGDYEYRNGTCRSKTNRSKQPACPEKYSRYGKSCHSPCPKGYQKKYGECVMPKDTLKDEYMTCPDSVKQHKVGAYCTEDMIECNVDAPGKFYYVKGKCERSKESIARVYTVVKPSETCPEGKTLVNGPVRVCQDPCPPYYKAYKGKCTLRRCTIPANSKMHSIVMCPEGKFNVPSTSE